VTHCQHRWGREYHLVRLTCLTLTCSHAIVSSATGPEYYVGIHSYVDKTQLEPGCSVLLHNKVRDCAALVVILPALRVCEAGTKLLCLGISRSRCTAELCMRFVYAGYARGRHPC
jgi:hypothetical protein